MNVLFALIRNARWVTLLLVLVFWAPAIQAQDYNTCIADAGSAYTAAIAAAYDYHADCTASAEYAREQALGPLQADYWECLYLVGWEYAYICEWYYNYSSQYQQIYSEYYAAVAFCDDQYAANLQNASAAFAADLQRCSVYQQYVPTFGGRALRLAALPNSGIAPGISSASRSSFDYLAVAATDLQ